MDEVELDTEHRGPYADAQVQDAMRYVEFEEPDPYAAPNANAEVLDPDLRPTVQTTEYRPGRYSVIPPAVEVVSIGRVSIKRRKR